MKQLNIGHVPIALATATHCCAKVFSRGASAHHRRSLVVAHLLNVADEGPDGGEELAEMRALADPCRWLSAESHSMRRMYDAGSSVQRASSQPTGQAVPAIWVGDIAPGRSLPGDQPLRLIVIGAATPS